MAEVCNQHITLSRGAGPHLEVALIDSHSLTRGCIVAATSAMDAEISFLLFKTIRECVLSPKCDFKLIIYYSHDKRPPDRQTSQQITALRQAYAEIPIILLLDNAHIVEPSFVRGALSSGARGVISAKTIEMATVSAAIRYVMAGGVVVPVDTIMSGLVPISESYQQLSAEIGLTSRQKIVLAHLREGKTNRLIARELHMSENTVKVHVRNIMQKMGATNRTQAVYIARRLHESPSSQTRAVKNAGSLLS